MPAPIPGAGDAIRSAGAAVQQIGAAVQDHIDREALATTDANIATSSAWAQEQIEALRTAPSAEVEDRRQQILDAWTKQRAEISGKAGTRNAREYARQHSDRIESSLKGSLSDISYQARALRTVDSLQASLGARAAVVDADPSKFIESVQDMSYVAASSLLDQRAQAAMRQQIIGDLSMSALRGSLRADPNATLAILENPQSSEPWLQGLSPEQRAKAVDVARQQITEQAVGGATSQVMRAFGQSMSAGNEALAALDLPEEQAVEVRRQVRAQLSILTDERSREAHDEVVAVVRKIDQGLGTPGDLRSLKGLYERGAISEAQHLSYIGRYDAERKAAAERADAQQRIMDIFAAGLPLDPSSGEHRKALDLAFASSVGQIPAGDPRWQAQARSLAMQTRMLPDSAIAWTRQAMRSPDAKVRAEAAHFFNDVEQNAPEALIGFDSTTKAYAGLVTSMVNAGTDPAVAAEAAAELTYKVTPQVREYRQTQYRDLSKSTAGALNALVNRDFDPGIFAAQPAVTQSLAADFSMLEGRYFEMTGDVTVARERAWRDVTRVYGPSKVNGEPVMMMMPPERFGVSPDIVRDEITSWLTENPRADESTPEDVRLVPDISAQRNAFSAYDGSPLRPSYRLIGKSGDLLTDKSGQPVTYRLPGAAEIDQRLSEKQAEQGAKSIKGARRKREVEQNMDRLYEQNPYGMGPAN